MGKIKQLLIAFLVLIIIIGCEKKATNGKDDNDIEIDPCAYEEQFSSIQALIDSVSSGDTVLIEPGTYEGTINFQGKDIVVGSLFLTTGDSSYISQTILDAKQSGSVVRFENSEGAGAVLSGLTLTGGYAVEGGGIYCVGASPTLSHLRIIDNHTYNCEEGEYFRAAAGGGIYIAGGEANISKVMVSGNSSEYEGGGIHMSAADPNLNLVTVQNNTATIFGGGMFVRNSGPVLSRVVVIQNEAEIGGGIYLTTFSNLDLENVVVGDNTAIVEGGGLFVNNSVANFVNVTITRDSALVQGGSMFMNEGSIVEMLNSILWGGNPEAIWFNRDGSPSSVTIGYSNVEGGLSGIITNDNGDVDWAEGNTSEFPAVLGNFCLKCPEWNLGGWYWPSGAIDKGDPSPQYNDEENLWCLYVWALEWPKLLPPGQVIPVPDTTSERNDMGAFGGPRGSWGIIHAIPGSEW